MRLIDADALRAKCDAPHWCVWMSDIDDAPTVDALPVVRCKDCTRRGTVRCPMYFEEVIDLDDDGLSLEIHDHTEDEGFCNYGEKENNDEQE